MKNICIVNHTHWDREWYYTFEEFRYRLKNAIEYLTYLLENHKIDSFFFDGQTIVIEDYKEIATEENFNVFIEFIQKGKIEIGPWYILPDEFLIGSESLIRNLQKGILISKRFNQNKFIGYLPDTFGHISQLPQVFKKLGINYALISRGAITSRSEVLWEGPDGTEIKTFVLPLFDGYYQPFLSEENYEKALLKQIDQLKEFCDDNFLILSGADHMMPAPDFSQRVAEIDKTLENYNIKQYKMMDYISKFDTIELKEKIHGEQRESGKSYILPGVLSTRTYLKKYNQDLEDMLTQRVEPMDAFFNSSNKNRNYIDYLWSLQLKNQPHDSICGCSTDEVHAEMVQRYKKAFQGANYFINDLTRRLCNKTASGFNDKLFVFNTLPYIISNQYIETDIILPKEMDKGSIELYKDDELVSVDILYREEYEDFVSYMESQPNWYPSVKYRVRFVEDFNGTEVKAYRIKLVEAEKRRTIRKEVFDKIENKYYEIKVNRRGFLNITHKSSQQFYENINQFVSSLDCGDEYNYCPPEQDTMYVSNLVNYYVEKGDTFQALFLEYELKQSECLNEERTKGVGEVSTKIASVIKLYNDHDVIDFSTTIDNKAKDQRLRVVFPLTEKVECAYGDTAFDLVKREVLRDVSYHACKMKEVKPNTYASQSVINAGDFSVYQSGLNEYEVTEYTNEQDALYLTLIRSVGWLSRSDFSSRGGGAGPSMKTEEAQCIGSYTFRYGLSLNEGYKAITQSKIFRNYPVIEQGQGIDKKMLNIVLDNPSITVTAIRQHSQGGYIIRMFNPSLISKYVSIKFDQRVDILETDLLENTMDYLAKEEEKIELIFGKKEIKTLYIKGD